MIVCFIEILFKKKFNYFWNYFKEFKSKKPSHNYGKIVIKTNDSNISLQINFNANIHNGIIEYDENKFRYFVSNNDNNFEISKHLP